MTYPRQTSMPMGIVFILCVCPSNCPWAWILYWGHICWKKNPHFCMLVRWLTLSLFMFMGIIVRPFVHQIFRLLCICWQISCKEWHKIWHADVSRWLTPLWNRSRWLLLSFHTFIRPSDHPCDWVWVLQTNRLDEMVYILACWYIQMIYLQFIDACEYYCRHGTKGIWVDRVLYLLCDLELMLWPWPWNGMEWKDINDMEPRGCESIEC